MAFFVMYMLCGIGVYLYFYKNTKDTLNPFGISLGLFLLSFGFSCLQLNPVQFELSLNTHFIIILTAIEIFCVGIIFTVPLKTHLRRSDQYPIITSNYTFFMYILVGIVFLTCFFVWMYVEMYQIYGNNIGGSDRKTMMSNAINTSRVVSYIIQILPYTVLYILYDLLFNLKRSKKKVVFGLLYIIWVIIFIWNILVSRGTLLIVFLGSLFLISRKYKLKLKETLFIFMGLAIIMALLMTLRMSSTSVVFSGNTSNAYFNTIYNYVAITFQVFDKLVRHGSPYSLLSATWITFSKILGTYNPDTQLLYTVGIYNAKTFLYSFYHDLGLIGIVVYPILIFSVIGFLYNKSMTTKPYYILYLATLQKPIMVIFFGNYFFGSFSNDIPYYTTFLLVLLSYHLKIGFRWYRNKRARDKLQLEVQCR